MSAPRKFSELRERATRMAVDLRRDPETRGGAIRRVSEQWGMHPETLRNWVRQAEVDGVSGRASRPATRRGWPSSSRRTARGRPMPTDL
jgi:transposase